MKTLAEPRARAEVLRRLKAVRPDSPRRWGRMSAHQMVCHLSDSMLVAFGGKDVSPATGPLRRTLVKWIALYAPLPWPRGIRTRPEVDQEQGGTKPGDFPRDRAQVEALIERMAAPGEGGDWHPHPIFGPMSEADWRRWGYLHADHHLRQFDL